MCDIFTDCGNSDNLNDLIVFFPPSLKCKFYLIEHFLSLFLTNRDIISTKSVYTLSTDGANVLFTVLTNEHDDLVDDRLSTSYDSDSHLIDSILEESEMSIHPSGDERYMDEGVYMYEDAEEAETWD